MYCCELRRLVELKRLIEERQQSKSMNGNVRTLCAFLVRKSEMGSEKSHRLWELKTFLVFAFFFSFFFLEVLQDSVITARRLEEKMHGGTDTK